MNKKTHNSLISRFLISLTLVLWPQVIAHSTHANCIPSSPKILETMNSTEPLIINELLIIEDIKKAYKALATQRDNPRAIASQFGTIDTTLPSENEVRPSNPDLKSLFVYDGVVDFNFRSHSVISLSALQKAFGSYVISLTRTNRTGSMTTYSIRFIADPAEVYGKQILIYLYHKSFDFKTDKIEVVGISIVG
jgi:hypothetical protein